MKSQFLPSNKQYTEGAFKLGQLVAQALETPKFIPCTLGYLARLQAFNSCPEFEKTLGEVKELLTQQILKESNGSNEKINGSF